MFELIRQSPLATGVAAAKGSGLAFGIIVALVAAVYDPMPKWELLLGIVLWYVTIGGIVGVSAGFDHLALYRVQKLWWLRGPMISCSMNLVLVLIAGLTVNEVSFLVELSNGRLSCPLWFVAIDGALAGIITAGITDRVRKRHPNFGQESNLN